MTNEDKDNSFFVWQNFILNNELHLSLHYIYQSIVVFNNIDYIKHGDNELFIFLYNLNTGFERLLKILLILNTANDFTEWNQKKKIINFNTHNCSKLIDSLNKNKTIVEVSDKEKIIFEKLSVFYYKYRYFHLDGDCSEIKNEHNQGLIYLYSKSNILIKDMLNVLLDKNDFITSTVFDNQNIYKSKMAGFISGLSTKLYKTLQGLAASKNIHTDEIAYNSDAYKLFVINNNECNQTNNDINVMLYNKELISKYEAFIYIINHPDFDEFREIVNNIEPVGFDETIQDSLRHIFINPHVSFIEELETGYTEMFANETTGEMEMEKLKERLDIIDAIMNYEL